jgi:cystathionine beta-lyase
VSIQPPCFVHRRLYFHRQDLFDRHWTDAYDYHSYGTHGTDTYTLADQLAQLEGGTYCLLTEVDYLPLIWLIQPF